MRARWTLTLVLLVASVALSAALTWYFRSPFLLFTLFLPFIWLGRKRVRADAVAAMGCPACGYRPTDPTDRFCPRDGTPLARP